MIFLIIILALALLISLYFNWKHKQAYPYGKNVRLIELGKDLIEITYTIDESADSLSGEVKPQASTPRPPITGNEQKVTFQSNDDCNKGIRSTESFFILCPPVAELKPIDKPPPVDPHRNFKILSIRIIKPDFERYLKKRVQI